MVTQIVTLPTERPVGHQSSPRRRHQRGTALLEFGKLDSMDFSVTHRSNAATRVNRDDHERCSDGRGRPASRSARNRSWLMVASSNSGTQPVSRILKAP